MNIKTIIYDPSNPNDIIDLINYNYDQLIANGYGAAGTSGAAGQSGVIGVQGQEGATGPIGAVGATGATGFDDIETHEPDTTTVNNTNILKPIQTLVYDNHLPNLIIGEDLINNRAHLTVENNLLEMDSNIRLTTAVNDKYFDVSLGQGSIEMSFGGTTSSKILLQGDESTLADSSDQEVFALFDKTNTKVEFKKNTIIDKTIEVLSNSRMESNNPQTGKIITAANEDGKLEWSPSNILGSNVNYGTIVPILSSEFFNSLNFEQTYTGNTNNTMGRGKNTYTGWYLCHGYTWYKGGGVHHYRTPRFKNDTSEWVGGVNPGIMGLDIINNIRTGLRTHIDVPAPNPNTDPWVATPHHWDVNTDQAPSMHVDWRYATTPPANHEWLRLDNDIMNIVYLGRDDLYWKYQDTSSYNSKSQCYYIDAHKMANTMFNLQQNDVKDHFQSQTDINCNYLGVSNGLIVPHHVPERIKFQMLSWNVYQSGASDWKIRTNQDLWEAPGVLARPGWYGSNTSGGNNWSFHPYGYWTGDGWGSGFLLNQTGNL